MLRCPVCLHPLIKEDNAYRCENKHLFDCAKEGYVNLSLSQKQRDRGDNKKMVDARHAFLQKGSYRKLQACVLEVLEELDFDVLLDAGCGEGYYTHAIYQAFNASIIAIDLSKSALKKCARETGILSVLSSLAKLPLFDQSVDVFLSIFSPYALDEAKRVLKNGGYFIRVKPGVNHLLELKENLYDSIRLNPDDLIDDSKLKLIQRKTVEDSVLLKQDELSDLLYMTPYAYKAHPAKIEALLKLEQLRISFLFILEIYRFEDS